MIEAQRRYGDPWQLDEWMGPSPVVVGDGEQGAAAAPAPGVDFKWLRHRHRWAVLCHGCGYGTTMETRAVARRWGARHVLTSTQLAVGAVVHRVEVLRVEYRRERDRRAERVRAQRRAEMMPLLPVAELLDVERGG